MSDKNKICEIGEKKLIDKMWYEKAEAPAGCCGCAFLSVDPPFNKCKRDGRTYEPIEIGGTECAATIWIACDAPQPEAPPVEECAGCRYGKISGAYGVCRRSQPGCDPIIINDHTAIWPVVKPSDWCGEWKA